MNFQTTSTTQALRRALYLGALAQKSSRVWGPKYKTLRSACEVLMIRNTKAEQ